MSKSWVWYFGLILTRVRKSQTLRIFFRLNKLSCSSATFPSASYSSYFSWGVQLLFFVLRLPMPPVVWREDFRTSTLGLNEVLSLSMSLSSWISLSSWMLVLIVSLVSITPMWGFKSSRNSLFLSCVHTMCVDSSFTSTRCIHQRFFTHALITLELLPVPTKNLYG